MFEADILQAQIPYDPVSGIDLLLREIDADTFTFRISNSNRNDIAAGCTANFQYPAFMRVLLP